MMATESAGERELLIPVSSPLSEWLDERAAAMGVDRETLLVRLLETYRSADEMDEEQLSILRSAVDNQETDRVDPDDIDEIEARIEGIETDLSDHVEDLRSRILQLKDAVEKSASVDHDHGEIDELSEQFEALSSDVEGVETQVEDISDEFEDLASELESLEEQFGTVETKLDRLARVVVTLKRSADGPGKKTGDLEQLRRTANRNGTTSADCNRCGEEIQIGLLTEAACPHCEADFSDIDYPSSIFGRFKTPKLVGSEALAVAPEDEDE